jgi:hypothetical protein
LICLLTLGFCLTANADDEWKFPNLNPFKKSAAAEKRARARISDQPKRGLPKLSLPKWNARPTRSRRSAEPSALEKLNQGSKAFFGKTKEVLMPWSKSSSKGQRGYPSASRTKKKSFWTAWLPQRKQKEKKKLRTVSDFIGQDRPDF